MPKILSIDGGGVRGLYAAIILQKIEEDYNIKFYNEFDIIIGTSTGSIIAAAISLENIPLEEICKKYQVLAKEVFKKSLRKYLPLFSKYNSKTLENNLKLIFGEKKIGEAKTKLMIPATIINPPSTYIHKNINQDKTISNNTCLTKIILSSCAAPIYFNPVIIDKDRELYVDGGLWSNNPSIIAFLEMLKTNTPIDEIKILSIGTGIRNKTFNLKQKCWGLIGWGTNLVNLFFDLQSMYPEKILTEILGEQNYLRINNDNELNLSLDKYNENLIPIAKRDYDNNRVKIKDFLK